MVTLYMNGTAAVIDGISVDYVIVPEEDADALLAVGWVRSVSELV